jgi:hypothetical protein
MNDKIIWDYLMLKINNPYGVAGLMGNLYVESKLNPVCLESSKAKKLGLTSEEYTQKVDDMTYTNFVNDGAGYGLAQWTYYTRKQGLLDLARLTSISIGSLDLQLDYLWTELQSYKTVLDTLINARTIRAASDIVVKRYEKSKNQSESFLQNRAEQGIKIYDKFINEKPLVYPTTDRVNVRCGNGLQYKRIAQVGKNESFEYVATANGWYAIVINDQVGWISSEFSKRG